MNAISVCPAFVLATACLSREAGEEQEREQYTEEKWIKTRNKNKKVGQ